MKDLSGKVAAVTGAASGIGRDTALLLAGEGCHIAIADMDKKGLEETAKLADRYGVKVSTHVIDVSDKDAVYGFADDVVKEHGSVNIIVNNAGVSLTAEIETMEYADFEWIMNINFWGVVYGTKAFLPYIKEAGQGRIINLSSAFGLMGLPTQSAYCSSKFAVRGFTETLQQELELIDFDIKAVCVHPGGVKTNIVRNSRLDNINGFVQDRDRAAARFDKIAHTTSEDAAALIIKAIRDDRGRLLIGKDARMIDRFQRLFPSYYQTIMLNKNRRFKELKKKNRKKK